MMVCKTELVAWSYQSSTNAATAPPGGNRFKQQRNTHLSSIKQKPLSPSVLFADNVEPELLHTYSRIDPYDTLILCVRVAVLTAVTLTVPIVLFPVSSPSVRLRRCVLMPLTDDWLCACRCAGPSCRCCSPPRLSTGCVTLPSRSLCSHSSTCW